MGEVGTTGRSTTGDGKSTTWGRGGPGEHIDHQGVGSNQEGKSTKGGEPINARGGPFDHSGEGGTEDPPSQDHYLGRWVDQFQNMCIRSRTCFWNGLASLWLKRGPTFLLGFGDRAERTSENRIWRVWMYVWTCLDSPPFEVWTPILGAT